MRIASCLLALVLCVKGLRADEPPTIDVDAMGMVRHVVSWPAEIPCRAGVWIVRDSWKSIRQPWDLKDFRYSPYGPEREIDSHYEIDQAKVALHQQIDARSVEYQLKSSADLDVTGAFWFCELDAADFAGGEVRIGQTTLSLPADKQSAAWIGGAKSDSFEVRSKDGTKTIRVRFDTPHEVRAQDARHFNAARFQIYVPIAEKALSADRVYPLTTSFEVQGPSEQSPVTIQVDASAIQSEFDGFGGNFVYAIEDPATRVTLDSLKLTWARIGIEAAKWEPTNDNSDAFDTNRAVLEANDAPGSPLRARFELDAKLGKMADGRLIASLWTPPMWLYGGGAKGGPVPRENWNELAECLTSYLLHLKTRYGVEPALFSFNESDIGIDVLLDGTEFRDLAKLLGTRFEAAGLRTKLLLGDSANLEIGLKQIQPMLDDAQAMKHIGALAYHPWMGQQEHWPAWAEAAQQRGLMLMATEMGDDPSAWHDGSFNSPLSTLHLARKYLQQLRDARTQVLLEWEWTGDYSMVRPDAKGKPALTNRGRFLQQLTQTTPAESNVVKAACDAQDVVAAVVIADDGKSAAVHLLNGGRTRAVRITGLPASLTLATLFVIDPLSGEKTPKHLEASHGVCEFEVPAGSIATLAFPPIH